MLRGCKLCVVHAEFDALVAPDLGEIVAHRLVATIVARLSTQMLQGLCLRRPALGCCNIRQEGASVCLVLRQILFKLDINSVRAHLPVLRVLNSFEVGQDRDFTAKGR